ncbi:uncharacterized protein LOC128722473 [Anopheles nili]|uniref:uncharacterized protein LOC128722473 n=1 Tax=Anopheles nili TaxID=185578 RepID=UPI00237B5A36|nr:uncharacterized protein LOC128722473 [Anopheles nili]
MALHLKLLLFAILSTSHPAAGTERETEVVQYVKNVSLFLSQRYFGTFICWLLQFNEEQATADLRNSVAQQLSSRENLSLLQADISTPHHPSLEEPKMIVICLSHLDANVSVENIRTWLEMIPASSVTILLFHATSSHLVAETANVLASFSIVYLIMIATNVDSIYTFNYAPLRVVRHSGFPSPEALLYDRVSELSIKSIPAAYVADPFIYALNESIEGEDIQLFKLFYGRLGIKLNIELINCNQSETTVMQCISDQNNSIILNRLGFDSYQQQCLVDTIEIHKNAIFVPRGRLLTIVEILMIPFDTSVWILFAILFVIFALLHRYAARMFQNNLFLLALFGWEKRTLHKTGRCEKLVAIGLIVLCFQLMCAYETLLISGMINWPSKPDPQTLEDLRKANIPVFVDARHYDIDRTYFNLEGIKLISTYKFVELKKEAFINNLFVLQLLQNDIFNIDPNSGGYLYVILEQTIWHDVYFYYFRKNSIFREPFARFRRQAFEAGLHQHWRQQMILQYGRRRHVSYQKIHHNTIEQNTIRLDNLRALFIILALLWCASGIVFLCELAICRLKKQSN